MGDDDDEEEEEEEEEEEDEGRRKGKEFSRKNLSDADLILSSTSATGTDARAGTSFQMWAVGGIFSLWVAGSRSITVRNRSHPWSPPSHSINSFYIGESLLFTHHPRLPLSSASFLFIHKYVHFFYFH